MTDEWTVFDARNTPAATTPVVTIQKAKNFAMNKAAYELLGEPEAVEYLFNEKLQKVGFRKVDPTAPHAYRVRKQANSRSFQMSGHSFITTYDIRTIDGSLRFEPRMEGDTLVIDLENPAAEVPTPQGGRRKARDKSG